MADPDEPEPTAEPATENPEDKLIARIDLERRLQKRAAQVVGSLSPRERAVLEARLRQRGVPMPRDPYR